MYFTSYYVFNFVDAGIKFYVDQSGVDTFSYESVNYPGQYITLNLTGFFSLASTFSGNVYKFQKETHPATDNTFLLKDPNSECYLAFDEDTGDQLPNLCSLSDSDKVKGKLYEVY